MLVNLTQGIEVAIDAVDSIDKARAPVISFVFNFVFNFVFIVFLLILFFILKVLKAWMGRLIKIFPFFSCYKF